MSILKYFSATCYIHYKYWQSEIYLIKVQSPKKLYNGVWSMRTVTEICQTCGEKDFTL